MDIIGGIQQDLRDELSCLDELILNYLSSNEEQIHAVGQHLLEARGKRIRPLLTITIAKMFDYKGVGHIKLAGAVEFIHTATLLHDDVVDESTMRRFKPTANVIWGSKTSILVGDFLFGQSFRLMVASGSLRAMKILSEALYVISEGEMSQLVKLNEKRIITAEEYYAIIGSKTAELFGASCAVGAIIAGKSNNVWSVVQNFGKTLGNIFQIVDDLLDYLATTDQVGKNIGDDFLEGKVTLPLIFLYKRLPFQEQKRIENMIKAAERSIGEFAEIRELMIKYEIRTQISEHLNILKEKAVDLLSQISVQNIYKDYLSSLIQFVVNRVH